MMDPRLTPFLLMNEMFKSYNAFVLLAVPFFLMAANIMNSAGITDRLVRLSRALVGHLPGGPALWYAAQRGHPDAVHCQYPG